jgi:hypothetical protein
VNGYEQSRCRDLEVALSPWFRRKSLVAFLFPFHSTSEWGISLQAAPSFAAFGRFLEATNPFLFWMRFAQTAWTPWFDASAARLPSRNFGRLPAKAEFAGPDSTSCREGEE